MKAYKGFNKDFTCRGFQFEVGKEYEEKEAVLCNKGFHACTNPLDVLNYYNDVEGKYCEVELEDIAEGKEIDSKVCGKRIKINAEIGFAGLFKMGVEWLKEQTIFSKYNMKDLNKSNENGARIGSSGNDARIGSSGDDAQIGSSGDYAQIGSSGNDAQIGSSGDYARIGSSGNDARIGSSGYGAQIGSSGDYARIGSSGYGARIGSSGNDARIGSSGNYAQIGSSGKNSVVMCAGHNSIAKAKIGSWITLSEWERDVNDNWVPINVVTKKVDGIEIKEDTYYKLVNGVFTEVDR
jgi:hypothetical protein